MQLIPQSSAFLRVTLKIDRWVRSRFCYKLGAWTDRITPQNFTLVERLWQSSLPIWSAPASLHRLGFSWLISNRFLQLLASGEDCETILATTFTRKGAGEILDRIVQRLARAALSKAATAELAEQLNWSLDQIRVQDLLREFCLLYTSPSPRDQRGSRMPSSA